LTFVTLSSLLPPVLSSALIFGGVRCQLIFSLLFRRAELVVGRFVCFSQLKFQPSRAIPRSRNRPGSPADVMDRTTYFVAPNLPIFLDNLCCGLMGHGSSHAPTPSSASSFAECRDRYNGLRRDRSVCRFLLFNKCSN